MKTFIGVVIPLLIPAPADILGKFPPWGQWALTGLTIVGAIIVAIVGIGSLSGAWDALREVLCEKWDKLQASRRQKHKQ